MFDPLDLSWNNMWESRPQRLGTSYVKHFELLLCMNKLALPEFTADKNSKMFMYLYDEMVISVMSLFTNV